MVHWHMGYGWSVGCVEQRWCIMWIYHIHILNIFSELNNIEKDAIHSCTR